MLKLPALHPEILATLAAAGHLSKVLISDGNFPHATKSHPRSKIVYANFVPGTVDAPTLLQMLTHLIPIDKVEVMEPERTGPYAMLTDPPIWATFQKILHTHSTFRGPLTPLTKPQFQSAVYSEDTALIIASAETQIFANILLTIGVVTQP